MKINTALQRLEDGFINWMLHRNWIVKCFLVTLVIPALLIAGVGIFTTPLYLGYMLCGFL